MLGSRRNDAVSSKTHFRRVLAATKACKSLPVGRVNGSLSADLTRVQRQGIARMRLRTSARVETIEPMSQFNGNFPAIVEWRLAENADALRGSAPVAAHQ